MPPPPFVNDNSLRVTTLGAAKLYSPHSTVDLGSAGLIQKLFEALRAHISGLANKYCDCSHKQAERAGLQQLRLSLNIKQKFARIISWQCSDWPAVTLGFFFVRCFRILIFVNCFGMHALKKVVYK